MEEKNKVQVFKSFYLQRGMMDIETYVNKVNDLFKEFVENNNITVISFNSQNLQDQLSKRSCYMITLVYKENHIKKIKKNKFIKNK